MTIYVDDARIPARVGRVSGRWSHLVTDNGDVTELHVFAQGIGLRLAWFQPGRHVWRPHYDLTDTRRAAALAAGAVPVGYRDVPAILAAARAANRHRVLVTGSRTWDDTFTLGNHLHRARELHPGAVLVHGDARGADRLAAHTWESWGLPTEAHPADWATYGRAAGHRRNAHMVALGADLCVAFIRDHSRGATGCADLADRAGIRTIRIRPKEQR